jgi:magnesium chelatase family protein
MYGQISTLAFVGIEARPVEVQVRITPGQTALVIVGLPDKAVAESREACAMRCMPSVLACPICT